MDAFLARLRFVLPLALINTAGYLLVNHYPLFAPTYLPPTPLDSAIPFLLWTIWPYFLLIFADFVLPFLAREYATFRRMLTAYAVAMSTNFLLWTFLPTAIARPGAPITDTVSATAYRLLMAVDAPGNCFPSGHVTIPAIGIWALAHDWPRLRAPLWAGLALLSISILTTKQHNVADLFGGFATALFGISVSDRLCASRNPRHA